MNFIDAFILVILIWFAYKGFTKGLVIELVSIIALSLGVYGGLKFSDTAAEFIAGNIDSKYMPIASFTLTFLVVVIVVFLIGKVIEKIINLVALKFLNKLAGAIFGTLKLALILSVLLTIIESYDQKLGFIPNETKENSLLYNPLLKVSSIVLPEIEKNNLFKNVKEEINSEEMEQE